MNHDDNLMPYALDESPAKNKRFRMLGEKLRDLDEERAQHRKVLNAPAADAVGRSIVRHKRRIENILRNEPAHRV